MTFEVCADSLETVLVADKYGCNRVELCSALSVGGLTPGFGLVKTCVKHSNLEIHVMIRHVEGHFIVSDTDVETMTADVQMASEAGAKGIVFGCLTQDNNIDIRASEKVINAAKASGLEVTFHRAFDFVNEPFNALDQLIDLGVNRLLTSGQQATALEGISLIKKLVEHGAGKLEIMAGSGINSTNALKLAEVGVEALHFSAHVKSKKMCLLGWGKEVRLIKTKFNQL